MLDLNEVLSEYDFHMFIVERRDGEHFVGNLYKTEAKARAVCSTYLKNDPYRLKHGYVFPITVDPSTVKHVENEQWIEDEAEARKVDKERIRQEQERFMREFFQQPGIQNFLNESLKKD